MYVRKKRYIYDDVPEMPAEGPIDLDSLFGNGSGPIELEIGFGRGHFLLDRAQLNPEVLFFGVETRRKWVHQTIERAKKRSLRNVIVRLADVRSILPRITRDACLDRVFIHFPDPWWKTKHLKRMVVTPVLLEHTARLLKTGGELFIQTDVEFRARAYLELLRGAKLFQALDDQGVVQSNPYGVPSLRELQCRQAGLPIYRLLFVRR